MWNQLLIVLHLKVNKYRINRYTLGLKTWNFSRFYRIYKASAQLVQVIILKPGQFEQQIGSSSKLVSAGNLGVLVTLARDMDERLGLGQNPCSKYLLNLKCKLKQLK